MPSAPIAALLARLACAGLLALSACSQGGGGALEVRYRLAEHLRAPHHIIPCTVGDETRPALGCPEEFPIAHLPLASSRRPAEPIELRHALPLPLRGRPFVLEARFFGMRRVGWVEAKPQLVGPFRELAELRLEVPAQVRPARRQGRARLSLRGFHLAPRKTELLTRLLEIPPGARLELGMAVRPPGVRGAPERTVRFTVEAIAAGHPTRLVDETIEPGEAPGWRDLSVDLCGLAGSRARLLLRTEVPDGDAGPLPFALWGAPAILAPSARARRRNVILVSLDTLRADLVGAHLGGRSTTPRMDRLSRAGTVFRSVMAPFPSTTASHMSLFTGLYPREHDVTFPDARLAAVVQTLPEILASHGYRTAAVTEDAMLSRDSGFARGFDFYREHGSSIWDTPGRARITFDAGLDWLRRHRSEVFFLFLHTYQVHGPYEPPEGYDVFAPPRRAQHPASFYRYAGDVLFTDRQVGRLLDEIRSLDLGRETLLVVTADHGEEFREHGGTAHSRTVYREVLHVPLVLWGPGLVPAGRQLSAPVSLVDVAPTILDLIDVAVPRGMSGTSLSPLLRGAPPPARAIYAEARLRNDERIAARTERFKWIAHRGEEMPSEVYDLERDPGEHHPLRDRELRRRGAPLIAAYRRRRQAGAPSPVLVDEAKTARLRALGYIDDGEGSPAAER